MTDVLKQIEDALSGDSDVRMIEALDSAYVEIERLRAECDHWERLVPRTDRALFPFGPGDLRTTPPDDA